MSSSPSHSRLAQSCFLILLLVRIGSSFVLGGSSPSPDTTRSLIAKTAQQLLRPSSTALQADNGGGGGGELVSTLARLDKQWKIQQRITESRRWTKINVNAETTTEEDENPAVAIGVNMDETVYLLEPPQNTIPSCIIVFVGGAGLGTYPHIAYNELLVRISDKLNAAVITTPYPLGLDHFDLAKRTGELGRKAAEHVRRKYNLNDTTITVPTFCLAHSLGCKLATIYMAATQQTFDGVGFMAFNNFGFGQTIGMAKEFAEQIQETIGSSGNGGRGSKSGAPSMFNFDQLFEMAEMAMDVMQIDFTPKPADMERIISLKYGPEMSAKTRLFAFDEDVKMDNSNDFVRLVEGEGGNPIVTRLPGTHLTPVFFQLGLDQIPAEARDFARGVSEERLGGIDSASFGNEEELNRLVQSVCAWIKGDDKKEAPKIAGSVEASTS